eukprot:285651-Alexandrium_andersonii.AAC.1
MVRHWWRGLPVSLRLLEKSLSSSPYCSATGTLLLGRVLGTHGTLFAMAALARNRPRGLRQPERPRGQLGTARGQRGTMRT